MSRLDDTGDVDIEDEPEEDAAHVEAVRALHELHRDVGRKALQKALAVIEATPAADIPINVAVQLLKFGAQLERQAVLGIGPDEEDDPFAALAGTMEQQPR